MTPQWLHARHGAYFVSAASFITAGIYLFLRVLFLCDGCLSSGYTMRDIVQQCAPPVLAMGHAPCRRPHAAEYSRGAVFAGSTSPSLRHSSAPACSTSCEPPSPCAKPPTLFLSLHHFTVAGIVGCLRHGQALREGERGAASRWSVFASEWVHDCWFAHVAAIGLIFITHPQADTRNSLIHYTIGAALVLGAHAIVTERRHGFLPRLVLVNAAVDAQAVAADSAAMDSVVSHSACLLLPVCARCSDQAMPCRPH